MVVLWAVKQQQLVTLILKIFSNTIANGLKKEADCPSKFCHFIINLAQAIKIELKLLAQKLEEQERFTKLQAQKLEELEQLATFATILNFKHTHANENRKSKSN